DRLFSGDAAQRLDLLADRGTEARHRKVAARADLLDVDRGAVDQETDGRARRGVPVAHVVGDRQNRFLADQRFAQDVREEAGRSLVRLAWADADGRQADADAVEEAATRIVGEQEFADRL